MDKEAQLVTAPTQKAGFRIPKKVFWDFNFKFLMNFYNIDDWKIVKRGETKDILKSFAWGNINSMERYHITAVKKIQLI